MKSTPVQHVPARHGLRINRGRASGRAAACSALPDAHQSAAATAAHEAREGMDASPNSPGWGSCPGRVFLAGGIT